ncbi:unnamed protein product [Agarophyton chilense]
MKSVGAAWYLGLNDTPICVAAHPKNPCLLSGFSEGEVALNVFSGECGVEGPLLEQKNIFNVGSSCVQATFHGFERFVVANSEGKLLTFDVSKMAIVGTKWLPHDEEGNHRTATTFKALDDSNVLVGDDCGGLHIFDARMPQIRAEKAGTSVSGSSYSCLDQGDYISAIVPVSAFNKDAFLVASGDGTLCAYDLRFQPKPKLKLQYAFDSFQEDLLSLAVLSKHSLAITGTLTGPLNIYNLRFMDDLFDPDAAAHVDRLYGHPEAVNVVMEWEEDEDVIISASSDGIIRIIDVPSRKLVGVLDYPIHPQESKPDSLSSLRRKKTQREQRWPIEDMVRMRGFSQPIFALLGHGSGIQFCDGSSLVEGESAEHDDSRKEKRREAEEKNEEKNEAEIIGSSSSKKKKRRRKGFEENKKKTDLPSFFEGL